MKHFSPIQILTAILIIILCSCNNSDPTIVFVSPDNNITIHKDTVLVIEIDAQDDDGVIDRIEIFIDDNIAVKLKDAPYKYYWDIIAEENIGEHKIEAIAYDDRNGKSSISLTVNVIDYRDYYCGEFDFTVRYYTWMMEVGIVSDTTFNYQGIIRKYEMNDCENDMYYYWLPNNIEDCDEVGNPNKKITVFFSKNKYFTTEVSDYGSLFNQYADNYGQSGGFIGHDSISVNIYSTWGMGAGDTYNVKGSKIK